MQKIQWVSRLFKWLLYVVAAVSPILLMVAWWHAPSPLSQTAAHYGMKLNYMPVLPQDIHLLNPLPTGTKILGFVISLIPLMVKLLILYFLICLFKRFERCEFFSAGVVTDIKAVGLTLVVGQLLNPIYQALLSTAVTWPGGTGHRAIELSFSTTNVDILLAALLVVLISWIMAEGHKMQQEQQYTI